MRVLELTGPAWASGRPHGAGLCMLCGGGKGWAVPGQLACGPAVLAYRQAGSLHIFNEYIYLCVNVMISRVWLVG